MFANLIPALALSAILSAQQNTVGFEVHTTNFPKDWSFQIELKLKYLAIDVKKMASEKRNTPTKKDYLLEYHSTNKHIWNISYDEKGNPKIEGSPQSVAFNFSKPISKLSNARSLIVLEGKLTPRINGYSGDSLPLIQTWPFESGAKYVLLIKHDLTQDGKNKLSVRLVTKDKLQDALEGKLPLSPAQGFDRGAAAKQGPTQNPNGKTNDPNKKAIAK